MQPHSMCALALANLTWNKNMRNLVGCEVRVNYKTPHGEKNYYYRLSNIEMKSNNEFYVTIQRAGGGLACTMRVKKDSYDRIEMTHGTQHIAGLTEIFKLAKDEIKDGTHRNSMKYRDFYGRIKYEETVELMCDIRGKDNKSFSKYPYTLTIESKTQNKDTASSTK